MFLLLSAESVLFVVVVVDACEGALSGWALLDESASGWLGAELSRLNRGKVAVSLRIFLLLRWLERERDFWYCVDAVSGLSMEILEGIMMSDWRLDFFVRLSVSALSIEEELPLGWLVSLRRVISVV